MDRLTTLELFTRIVDRRSFSAAAGDMRVSRPAATAAIKALETRLGTRLLQRSTRHVTPTAEGEAYYSRCISCIPRAGSCRCGRACSSTGWRM